MFSDGGFEIGETDGLQAHIGVVKILNRRLDEQNFHGDLPIYNPLFHAKESTRFRLDLVCRCDRVGGGNDGRSVFKARALRKSKRMRFSLRTKQRIVALGLGLISWAMAGAAQSQVDWKKEWERSLQEAKKEGVIVVGIPARAELRKELEAVFKPQFGIDMELLTARGPQN